MFNPLVIVDINNDKSAVPPLNIQNIVPIIIPNRFATIDNIIGKRTSKNH